MLLVDIDGIVLDISKFSKKLTYQNKNGKILITYVLDFPPYTGSQEFDNIDNANKFISTIKNERDRVKYK